MTHIYEIKHSYMYDIENYMMTLENYLITLGHRPKPGLYVRGRRFPYTSEEHGLSIHYNNANGTSGTVPLDLNAGLPRDINVNIIDGNENLIISGYNLFNNPDNYSILPLHPVMIVDFISQIIDYLQFDNVDKDLKELFFIDIVNQKEDYLLDPMVRGGKLMVEDIVASYFNGLNQVDLQNISDLVNSELIPLFYDFMHERNMLYSIDMSTPVTVLKKHNDIRAIRYMKLHEDIRWEEQVKKEYEENV